MHSSYYLAEEGAASGPHSLAVLRQKAEIRVLRPDSLVYPGTPTAQPAAWTTIRDLPDLHAHLFPAHPLPSLGTAHFQSENARHDATLAPTDVTTLLRDNTARQTIAENLRPPPPPVAYRYHRTRDYLWCAAALNLPILLYGLSSTFLSPLLIGLFVVGNIGLAWVFFSVMDRY
jgi:hypothetical protein